MTTPSITDLLKYADLQMAAEAFLVEGGVLKSGLLLEQALTFGNGHASKFTQPQVTNFLANWEVLPSNPTPKPASAERCFSASRTTQIPAPKRANS